MAIGRAAAAQRTVEIHHMAAPEIPAHLVRGCLSPVQQIIDTSAPSPSVLLA
jgi:hypothetical protein